MTVELRCFACGGTTSMRIPEGETSGVEECCCGAILFYSKGEEPPSRTLRMGVADGVGVKSELSRR